MARSRADEEWTGGAHQLVQLRVRSFLFSTYVRVFSLAIYEDL